MAKTKAELLATAGRRYTEVEGVRLQSLDELECSTLEARWVNRYEKNDEADLTMRRELLCICIVDDEGERLFKSNEVDQLAGLDSALIRKLYVAAREHCGMDAKVDKESKAKKFEETVD